MSSTGAAGAAMRLAAARAAWQVPGPRRVFDPNARPRLLTDVAGYRAVVEDREPENSAADAARSVALVLAGRDSAERGGVPVPVVAPEAAE